VADDVQFRDGNGALYTARMIDVGSGVKALVALVETAAYICDKYTTLSVTTASTALTAVTGGVPAVSSSVVISVPPGGGDIYYSTDGTTAPTNGTGIYIPAGAVAEITVKPLSNVKLIASAGTIVVTCEFRHFATS